MKRKHQHEGLCFCYKGPLCISISYPHSLFFFSLSFSWFGDRGWVKLGTIMLKAKEHHYWWAWNLNDVITNNKMKWGGRGEVGGGAQGKLIVPLLPKLELFWTHQAQWVLETHEAWGSLKIRCRGSIQPPFSLFLFFSKFSNLKGRLKNNPNLPHVFLNHYFRNFFILIFIFIFIHK
jgi:hypothetical protein